MGEMNGDALVVGAGTAALPAASPPSNAFVDAAKATPLDLDRLEPYLAVKGFHLDREHAARQFAGGLANRNYLLKINDRFVVLRRPPSGDLPPGSHDMAREHRILSRLSKVLPIAPDSLHLCQDISVIGVPFQLLQYVDGLVIRGSDLSAVAAMDDVGVRLSRIMIATLSNIHGVDADACGLGDLGRPDGFVGRAVAGWTKRGAAVFAANAAMLALVGEAGDRLARHRFRGTAPALLHSDFKLDNMILDPKTLEPRAVVDWDMGTRGDPIFDLAVLLSYWAEPGDPECLVQLDQLPTATFPGFWTREQAAQAYAGIAGRSLDDLPALYALAILRLAVIFAQLHNQWVGGAVKDMRYARFRQSAEGLLLRARDLSKGLVQ